jgi:outer membrane protein assembly factor BamB
MKTPAITIGIATLWISLVPIATAENWPEWRGPGRNGVSSETNLPVQWSAEKNIRWKTPLPGQGVSSPVIWGDRIFLTAAEGSSQSELIVLCLALKDGKENWRLRLWGTSPTLRHATKSGMATPTPITDGTHLYAFFGTGDVFCIDHGGSLVWQRSLADEYGAFENRFGHTSSPALLGDLLFLQCDHYGDSYLLAIDKRTGQNRWKQDRPGVWHSWSSPQLVQDVAGNSELVVCAAERIDAFQPETGQPLWTVGGLQRECIPTPVTGHGLVFAVSGPKGTAMAIRPGSRGDVSDSHVVWRSKRGSPYVPSAILVGDHYYLVDDAGIATCLDAHSGDLVWQKRLGGAFTASPIAAGGKIYFTNDDGDTTVITAGEDSLVELAKNSLGEPVYSSGAISQGCLFLRTPKHLFCISQVRD